jgi:hypothetical protein
VIKYNHLNPFSDTIPFSIRIDMRTWFNEAGESGLSLNNETYLVARNEKFKELLLAYENSL